ncbi:carbohydrate ABC transporter permease [Alkaliphilus transvaalensis]|uniref:carbohydrate ABC transporter permease n=1 Tax=Alkaliphilus transvaalensis TaxID=114628 RepID=UPI002E8E4F33|nr:sugar ABC transporter permease [Alkaliphilus transvaalensis]
MLYIIVKKLLIKKNKSHWLYLIPSIVGLSIFYLLPFIWMIYYSFLSNPVNGRFVGFQNYIELINNNVYRLALGNTALFTLISVPSIILLSLLVALLLNKNMYYKEKLKASFIIPLVVPVASIILFFDLLFDTRGVLNNFLTRMGGNPIDWLNSNWSMLAIIIIFIWKNIGYNIVLFMAGLAKIPTEYYEAASIEGANSLQKFLNITIVYLSPTMFFVLVISIINSFKIFKEIYLLAGEYPHRRIYMLQHYLNNMFIKLEYNKLVTSAILFALIIYISLFLLFKLQRKIGRDINW